MVLLQIFTNYSNIDCVYVCAYLKLFNFAFLQKSFPDHLRKKSPFFDHKGYDFQYPKYLLQVKLNRVSPVAEFNIPYLGIRMRISSTICHENAWHPIRV